MRGVAIIVVISFLAIVISLGSPPIKEPIQYEQLSNGLNVSGTGVIDMSTSAIDKRIALDYFNSRSGNGNLEMNSDRVFSESARKVSRDMGMDNLSNMNLVGFDTKSIFNGTWTTDTSWHKLLDKNINSHQSFSGKFEMDRQLNLHEKATYKSAIKCTKTPSSVNVSEGDVVTYEYKVCNPSDTVISDINLVDSDLGRIKLDRTALGPNESTIGAATYTVTEDDILTGPREIITTATGVDNQNERVECRCSSWLVPIAEYYEGNTNTLTAIICPGCEKLESPIGNQANASYEMAPGYFNLCRRNLTFYALDVNMTESRYPLPSCPYNGWPNPEISTILEFGLTSDTEVNTVDPTDSVWQSLSLEPGAYLAKQAYRGSEGGVVLGGIFGWNTPYAGASPNGGFHCTGDPQYDTFDLKMVLADLGPGGGFRADAYQRVYKSADRSENAYEWKEIGSQVVPEYIVDKTSLRPFILVADAGNSTGGGTISWSKVIAAD